MEQSKTLTQEAKENLAGDVMESVGEPREAGVDVQNASDQQGDVKDDLPEGIKKRLGMQEKRHQKEMRAMQQQMQNMQSQLGSSQQSQPQATPMNPYTNQPIQPGSAEDQIHRAVNAALRARDEQERKAQDAAKVAHVQKQYQSLQDDLDKASHKYEDFDEVVRSPDAPFTAAMRDASLLLPNRADVLYKLGKNPEELQRISALHPIDQAKELVKLSHALISGGNKQASSAPSPIGQIKSNPVKSSSINDTTPVSEIRARMKAGWR